MGFNRNLGNIPQVITELNGNIGIGTTSPGTTTTNTLLGFVNGSNIQARTAVPQIAMSSNIDGDWYSSTYKTNGYASQIIADGYYGNISFRTAPSGTAGNAITWNGAAIYIQNDSKVGIGTTSPNAKLEINGSGGYGVRIGEGGEVINGCSSSGYSGLYLQHTGNANNLLLVNGGGKVGIGTTSVGYKCQIESGGADVFLTKNTSATLFNRSFFYNNSNVGIQIQSYGSSYPYGTTWPGGANSADITCNSPNGLSIGTSTASAFVLGTSSTERMRITPGGETYIQAGTGYQIRIQPNCQINTFLNSSGAPLYLNFQGNGAIYAGSSYAVLYAGSDRRIKTDIKDAESTLNKILNLTPRTFRYKERPNDVSYGFIAQEVEEVMPEIVKTSEGISNCAGEEIVDQKSIESYGLAWASILVKAMQEQQEIIKQLTNRIINLENK